MKLIGKTVLALIAGFFAGYVLSDIIAIASYLLFHKPVGLRYLPYYLAVVSAVAVHVVERQRRSN